MRFLFLIFALLGLVTFQGSQQSRTNSGASMAGQRSITHSSRPSSVETVTISDDGTPIPRR
jgi:hypothetical protein